MMIICVILNYGSSKLLKVIKYENTSIIESKADSFFDDDKIISSDDGIQFAFGIVPFGSKEGPIDDPDYGQVVAINISWYCDSNTCWLNTGDLIPTKECTYEDLGIIDGADGTENNPDRSATRFYPIHKTSMLYASIYRERLRCFDFEAIS